MKALLFVLFLLPSICSAQLVFEVNSPTTERGVFPCMAGKNSEWTNSPDLYQNGSWFSDTVILADDGVLGSACSSLNNSIISNFVLFQRSGCSLGQSLLNAQNAGATGAIVIDSVDGRPLPFDPDGLSDSISIPFVIISQGKGDSLIQRIFENQDVVVSFGDKTGININDIGIYKEFSLWSRYGIFPFGSYHLPDDHFGTWVYNHGTTDASNLQVKLWFYHDPNYPQHNQDSLSLPFDLAAGDSTFVNFDFEYTNVSIGYAITESNPLKYGYEIIGAVDDDILDNSVSNILYSEDDLISNTFSPSLFNTDFSEVDYFIEGASAGYDSIGYCLYFPMKITSNNAILCEPIVPMVMGTLPGGEQTVGVHRVNIINQQATLDHWDGYGHYYFDPQPDSVYIDPIFYSQLLVSENIDIVASIITSSSAKLGYSSDMYHDEQIRQGYLPTYFRKELFTSDSLYEPQFIITPILSFNMTDNGGCYLNNIAEIEGYRISLFPNPVSDILAISSSESIKSITLFDMLGKKIAMYEGGNQLEKNLNVESLKSGCYLIEVANESGQRKALRFIKE